MLNTVDRIRDPTGVATEVVGMEEERTRSDLSASTRSCGDERAAAAAGAALGVRVEDREQEAQEMVLKARQIMFALLNSPIIVYKIYIPSL